MTDSNISSVRSAELRIIRTRRFFRALRLAIESLQDDILDDDMMAFRQLLIVIDKELSAAGSDISELAQGMPAQARAATAKKVA